MVRPRNVIWPGGAGWIERSEAGAVTVGRTRAYASEPTSSGTSTSSAMRSGRRDGWTSVSRIGRLNSRQRASLSLT
jgi:hypothetical protein